jgi:hypothetical protein
LAPRRNASRTLLKPPWWTNRRGAQQALLSADQYTSELATVQGKRRHTEQLIGQYLGAFERGTMPEDVCGPRLVELRAE